jgi:hypothetical protein
MAAIRSLRVPWCMVASTHLSSAVFPDPLDASWTSRPYTPLPRARYLLTTTTAAGGAGPANDGACFFENDDGDFRAGLVSAVALRPGSCPPYWYHVGSASLSWTSSDTCCCACCCCCCCLGWCGGGGCSVLELCEGGAPLAFDSFPPSSFSLAPRPLRRFLLLLLFVASTAMVTHRVQLLVCEFSLVCHVKLHWGHSPLEDTFGCIHR